MQTLKTVALCSICFFAITIKASEKGFNPEGSVLLIPHGHPAFCPDLTGFDEYERQMKEKEKNSVCGCFTLLKKWVAKKRLK